MATVDKLFASMTQTIQEFTKELQAIIAEQEAPLTWWEQALRVAIFVTLSLLALGIVSLAFGLVWQLNRLVWGR